MRAVPDTGADAFSNNSSRIIATCKKGSFHKSQILSNAIIEGHGKKNFFRIFSLGLQVGGVM